MPLFLISKPKRCIKKKKSEKRIDFVCPRLMWLIKEEMDISKYTLEDFVLDPSFRNWVLNPNAGSNIKWEELLDAFPSKYPEAEKAREVVLRMYSRKHQQMNGNEFLEVWEKIENELTESTHVYQEEKIIPLNSFSTFSKSKIKKGRLRLKYFSYMRTACAVFLLVALGLVIKNVLKDPTTLENPASTAEYVERST